MRLPFFFWVNHFWEEEYFDEAGPVSGPVFKKP